MAWLKIEDVLAADPPTEREISQALKFLQRKARPRFYADENFPPIAVDILRERGADVVTVLQNRAQGHPDENHTAEALRLERILITCDRDYLDERRFPLMKCPAIVVCNFGRGTSSEISDTFNCLNSIFRGPQFYDKWSKIDATRDGWSEYSRFLDGTTARHRYRIHHGRIEEWVENK